MHISTEISSERRKSNYVGNTRESKLIKNVNNDNSRSRARGRLSVSEKICNLRKCGYLSFGFSVFQSALVHRNIPRVLGNENCLTSNLYVVLVERERKKKERQISYLTHAAFPSPPSPLPPPLPNLQARLFSHDQIRIFRR